MSLDEIKELRKKFIIDESEYDTERIKEDIDRLIPYCKVSASGRVLIRTKGLTEKKKVGLVVVARYIGHRLDSKIDESLKIDDISNYTGTKRDNVMAYLSELVKEGICNREKAGSYRANPGQISDFLDELEKKPG